MDNSQSKHSAQKDASFGVEALIQKLKQDGVDAGQAQARTLVQEAELRANWIVDQANHYAKNTLRRGHCRNAYVLTMTRIGL
jgi:hypothetical protein